MIARTSLRTCSKSPPGKDSAFASSSGSFAQSASENFCERVAPSDKNSSSRLAQNSSRSEAKDFEQVLREKSSKKLKSSKKAVIGWKEWFHLDGLGLPAIKGKIDTGAKTSSLHAFNIENFYIEDVEYVKFDVHPLQKNKKSVRHCIARVIDRRMVSDSSGRKEKRFVIKSVLCIGDREFRIELTLANRDSMAFRMLLGRDAVKQLGMIVDPSKSFVQGKIKSSKILEFYCQTKQKTQEINL